MLFEMIPFKNGIFRWWNL